MTGFDAPAAPLRGASYLIPVDNVPALIRRAGKLLGRARKAGVDCGLEWRLEPQPQVLRAGDLHQWVTILSRPPAMRGWSLAARYDTDPLGMAATIPRAVPGVELPRRFWTLGEPVCEHCNTARDRRAVFLLAHRDGRHLLVGRSCLRAFLDRPDPIYLMSPGVHPEPASGDRAGRAPVAYASGFDPTRDEGMAVWDRARDAVGGDDFAEAVPLEWVDAALAARSPEFVLEFGADAIGLLLPAGPPSR